LQWGARWRPIAIRQRLRTMPLYFTNVKYIMGGQTATVSTVRLLQIAAFGAGALSIDNRSKTEPSSSRALAA